MIRVMFHDQLAGTESPIWLTEEEYENLRRSFGARGDEPCEVALPGLDLYLQPLEVARAQSQPPPPPEP